MINIDGVEYVPIDSIELDGSEDIQERLSRAKDELNSKKQNRKQVEQERELKAYIEKYYGKDLKDVGAFIQLCKIKGLKTADTAEILTLFKSLPKAARKGALSRFLKL